MRATRILALNRDPEAARSLSGHLGDSDPFVRRQALIAVAQSELPGKAAAVRSAMGAWAYGAVMRAARDPDTSVRTRAAGRLRFWRAAPAL